MSSRLNLAFYTYHTYDNQFPSKLVQDLENRTLVNLKLLYMFEKTSLHLHRHYYISIAHKF